MKLLCTSIITLLFSYTIVIGQIVTTVSEGIFVDGIGIDSNQIIYCSDYFGDQVYSYNPQNGQVAEFANGLVTPNGIGVVQDNNIYVCEATANRITVFDNSGNQIDQITGLTNPTGIKYDITNQRLLVVSYSGNSLLSIDPTTNQIQMIVDGPPFNGPSGIAFIDDNIYLSNFNDRKIFKLTTTNELEEITQLPATASIRNFCGFLTAKNGLLYATQQGEHRVYQINPDTGETTIFSGSVEGSVDGDLEDAEFNRPNGIIADEVNDRIYVSEIGSKNLRVISDVSLGLKDQKLYENHSLYPNPVDDILYLKNMSTTIEEIAIYDLLGKLISRKRYNNELLEQINVEKLITGTYLIEITVNGVKIKDRFFKK